MGFADRQYARYDDRGRSVVGTMRMWSVTTWLIVINVGVFLLNVLSRSEANDFGGWLYYWGHFSAATVIGGLQLWRFITFQFLHAGPEHLIFNMIALYFFGPIVEGYLGSRKYLAFYLLCGIAGGVMYLGLLMFGVLRDGPLTPLVGASAGIFGVLVASARVAPDTTVMLIFPPIPLRLRVVAWVMLAMAVYIVFSNGANAGGEASHLGGAAVGALLIWRPELLNIFDWPRRRRRRKPMDDWR
jgi:membrane associated rhomboid family serine protease